MSVDNKNTFSPNQTFPIAPIPTAERQHLRAAMARHEEDGVPARGGPRANGASPSNSAHPRARTMPSRG